jgi:uncharacterized protein YcnI
MAIVATVLAYAAPAQAHVTVSPNEAVAGSTTRLTFQVPDESENARTTQVEVHFPEDAPLATVSVLPVPGWKAELTETKLSKPIDVQGHRVEQAASMIKWTATDSEGGIKPGQFQEFPVSAGPIPSGVNQLVFKASQTYSDGKVVHWNEDPKPGATLEHPAPVLTVVQASAPGSPLPAAALGAKGGNNALVWVALVVGVLALLLAGFAVTRSRRPGA